MLAIVQSVRSLSKTLAGTKWANVLYCSQVLASHRLICSVPVKGLETFQFNEKVCGLVCNLLMLVLLLVLKH